LQKGVQKHINMKKDYKAFLFPLFILLLLFSSCAKEDSNVAGVIDGPWTVVSWTEDGVPEPDIASYEITLSFTNVANKTGIMTFNTSVIPFNYTGTFSIDANNLLTATLNETTNNMEINQWILSMNATIGANNLTLDGSTLKKSPFWPDATANVIFEATR
jgi:hypothetical protein